MNTNLRLVPFTNYPLILFPLNAYEVSFQVRTLETKSPFKIEFTYNGNPNSREKIGSPALYKIKRKKMYKLILSPKYYLSKHFFISKLNIYNFQIIFSCFIYLKILKTKGLFLFFITLLYLLIILK